MTKSEEVRVIEPQLLTDHLTLILTVFGGYILEIDMDEVANSSLFCLV